MTKVTCIDTSESAWLKTRVEYTIVREVNPGYDDADLGRGDCYVITDGHSSGCYLKSRFQPVPTYKVGDKVLYLSDPAVYTVVGTTFAYDKEFVQIEGKNGWKSGPKSFSVKDFRPAPTPEPAFKLGDRVLFNRGGDGEVYTIGSVAQDGTYSLIYQGRDYPGYEASKLTLAPAPKFKVGDSVVHQSCSETVYTIRSVETGDRYGIDFGTLKCCAYPGSELTLFTGTKSGDRVEVSFTAELVSESEYGYIFESKNSDKFAISKNDINGRPKVLKAKPKPWELGGVVRKNGKEWIVDTVLSNEKWAVLREIYTDNNLKLAHVNDPSFVR